MGFFVWKSQRIHDKNIHLYVGYSEKGIGNIPNAVLRSLINHKDLGIHSEMFSDGVIDLIEAGCITNSHKKILPGQIVGSFCLGSRRLYDFLDNNPFIGKIAFHTSTIYSFNYDYIYLFYSIMGYFFLDFTNPVHSNF